jgi:uncharacterized membrane protein YkoI
MKRYSILFAIIAAVFVTGALVTATAATQEAKAKNSQAQEKLRRQAKITMEQARETAIKRAPGTVEDGELEREHGRLIYSFDIRNAKGTITEVQVSALTGQVLRVDQENKRQEAAEKHKDSQKSRQKR